MPSPPPSADAQFSRETFKFLAELAKHNDRAWFEKNKPRYEAHVRAPALAFVLRIAPKLHQVSPELVADPKPVGGSVMRIYRDTRFSKDKTPYKTNVGIGFHHRNASKNVNGGAPGLYAHVSPEGSFVGGGVWHPDPATLNAIREAIVAKGPAWKKATKGLELDGESLARAPRGFDPEHPLVADLKRKDFMASVELKPADVASPRFDAAFLAAAKKVSPLAAFVAGASGLAW